MLICFLHPMIRKITILIVWYSIEMIYPTYFSKSKSIKSCMIAQKKILKDKPIEEIKVFCEEEINKNIK